MVLVAIVIGLAIILSWDLLAGMVVAAWRGQPSPFHLDLDAMLIAGRAAMSGHLADAYSMKWMHAAEMDIGYPATKWLSYTYPPTAGLLFGPLSTMSSSWAFLLLESVGLIVFATGLSSLCTRGARAAILFSSLPVVCFNLRSGQAGLLTAGLAAHGARLWLAGRSGRASVLAGLLTLKPHMALALPLTMLVQRDWRGLIVYGAIVIGLAVAALAAFGTAPWLDYPGALSVVGANLASGALPMARLTSAYAAAVGIGLHGGAAWAVHLVQLALVTSMSMVIMVRCHDDRRVVIGMSMVWSVFVSPYVYDYDLAILTVAAAVFSGTRLRDGGTWTCLNLLASLCIAQSIGLAWWTAGGRGGLAFFALFPMMLVICAATQSAGRRLLEQPSATRRIRSDLATHPAGRICRERHNPLD